MKPAKSMFKATASTPMLDIIDFFLPIPDKKIECKKSTKSY